MRMLALLALSCLILQPASPTHARDIYVNNLAGSDDFSGFDQTGAGKSGPVRTINRAVQIASVGDRIVIAKTAEPYREQITIGGCLKGTKKQPLVITSDGAVLDGSVVASPGAWRHLRGNVFSMRPHRLAYQQLFDEGRPLRRVRLTSTVGADLALQPLEWSLTANQILLSVEEGKLPESYNLRHAGLQTGITLYNTRNVVIEGLIIQGFQQDAINAHEMVKDCVVRNIECRANGRSGLSAGGVSRVTAIGCNFYDNGQTQVRVEGLAKLSLEACDIDKQANAPAFEQAGGELLIDGKPANN